MASRSKLTKVPHHKQKHTIKLKHECSVCNRNKRSLGGCIHQPTLNSTVLDLCPQISSAVLLDGSTVSITDACGRTAFAVYFPVCAPRSFCAHKSRTLSEEDAGKP